MFLNVLIFKYIFTKTALYVTVLYVTMYVLGIMNYVMISLPVDSTTELMAVNVETGDKFEKIPVAYHTIDKGKGLYVLHTYITPGLSFKITVIIFSSIVRDFNFKFYLVVDIILNKTCHK